MSQARHGERYEGEWSHGVRAGVGKVQRRDGSVWCGEFLNGSQHGVGTEIPAVIPTSTSGFSSTRTSPARGGPPLAPPPPLPTVIDLLSIEVPADSTVASPETPSSLPTPKLTSTHTMPPASPAVGRPAVGRAEEPPPTAEPPPAVEPPTAARQPLLEQPSPAEVHDLFIKKFARPITPPATEQPPAVEQPPAAEQPPAVEMGDMIADAVAASLLQLQARQMSSGKPSQVAKQAADETPAKLEADGDGAAAGYPTDRPGMAGPPADVGQTVLEEDSEHRVVYRIMRPPDVSATLHVLANAFFEGEPVTGCCGCSLRDQIAFCELFVPRMSLEGNTVIAVDMDSNEVLGGFLCEDYCNPDPPGLETVISESDGNFVPVTTIIGELELRLNDQYAIPAERVPGRWFHLWMLGVAPEGRGRSIAKKLTRHAIEWAETRGFLMAFAETTGAVSTHIMSAHATPRAFVSYGDWTGDCAESVRALVDQGHKGMSMMVADFSSQDEEETATLPAPSPRAPLDAPSPEPTNEPAVVD